MVGLENDRTPLRSRLLAVPEYRERYLGYIRQIASNSLNWDALGPEIKQYRELIDPVVQHDTRMNSEYADFQLATAETKNDEGIMSYAEFAEERSKFLLEWLETEAAGD